MRPAFLVLAALAVAGTLAACDTVVPDDPPGGLSEADHLGTWRMTEAVSQQYVTTTVDASALEYAAPGTGAFIVDGAPAAPLRYIQGHTPPGGVSCAFGPDCIERITLSDVAPNAPVAAGATLKLSTTAEPHELFVRGDGPGDTYTADPVPFTIEGTSIRLPSTPFRNTRDASDVVTVGGQLAFSFVPVAAGVETAVGAPLTYAPTETPAVGRQITFRPAGVFQLDFVSTTTGQVVRTDPGTWTLTGDTVETETRDANGFRDRQRRRVRVEAGGLALLWESECADASCLPVQSRRLFLPTEIVERVRYDVTDVYVRVP